MCGIAGFLRAHGDTEANVRIASAMASALAHRGPDDQGVWTDGRHATLAHRRLAILDLSEAGHQPMESASGRYVIVYNGEIYNHLALRREVGHVNWRGHSDTETLLACFDAWGVEATLKRTVGMFAFGLWDKSTASLFLARDRLGEKPLYYGVQGDTFLFASELSAIAKHDAFSARIDRNAVAMYLRYGYIPAPHSIYEGILKLPPGTYLNVNVQHRASEPVVYWSMKDVVTTGQNDPFVGSDDEACDALDHRLREAVVGQMLSDVPVGAFLSGGIDSSAVVAMIQAQTSRAVKTFTIGFQERGYDEAMHAARVAAHLGTDHTELYVTPREAMDVIPTLPAIYGEPFADSSQIPLLLVSKLAKQRVAVALSGDGGDEIFGGYNRHFWVSRLWSKLRWIPKPLRDGGATMLSSVPTDAWERLAAILGPVLPAAARVSQPGAKMQKLTAVLRSRSPEEAYTELISHWRESTRVVKGAVTAEHEPVPFAGIGETELQLMLMDTIGYLPDDILVKVDRAAMSVSLETRVPLLDHRVVEFAWRLPLSMRVRNGTGKWILRRLLARYLPYELVDRPKAGFTVPIAEWLRDPLRDWAESLLNERALERGDLFFPGIVRAIWQGHLSGARDWSAQLWDILMFQAWRQAHHPA